VLLLQGLLLLLLLLLQQGYELLCAACCCRCCCCCCRGRGAAAAVCSLQLPSQCKGIGMPECEDLSSQTVLALHIDQATCIAQRERPVC
jgi:hypothetical protein